MCDAGAMIEPTFEHDCDECAFLGHLLDHDVYVCPQGGIGLTLIARYGDKPEENGSGLAIVLSKYLAGGESAIPMVELVLAQDRDNTQLMELLR